MLTRRVYGKACGSGENNTVKTLVHEVLGRLWHASVDVLEEVAEEEGRWCYRALSDRGCLFVKLQRAACGPGQEILNGLRIQSYIAQHGLPISEILLSAEGLGYAQLDAYCVTVERWVSSQTSALQSGDWHDLGTLCGKLHRLPIPSELAGCVSRLEPELALPVVREQVSHLRRTVPHNYSARVDRYLARAEKLDDFPKLPRVLVHSDITWGNVLRSQAGPLVLIDLEGAGIAPAVMDLVEVTTKLCLGPSASGPLQTEAARAFYAGYRDHRLLSLEEVMAFSDAHFFHQFFYLANSLQRADFGYIDRMEARLANWENGILDRLTSAAHGILQ